MGLLDALFPTSDGGGLLDFLKHNAQAQSFPSGLPSDQAQYGAPAAPMQPPAAAPGQGGWGGAWPQDTMQWPQGPIGAPTSGQPQAPAMGAQASMQPPAAPPMAAPAMAPPQAAPQGPQEPNFFNRAADALGSISRGGSMLGAIRGQFDDPRSQTATQSNLTARALISRGVDPQVAIAAVQPGNTAMLGELFKQIGAQGMHSQETDKDGNVWDVNRQTGQKTIALAAKSDKYIPATTTNPDGTKTTTLFNTETKEFVKPPGSDQPASGKYSVPDELTGPERMKALQAADPMYARKIQAIVNGDMPMPTGVAALKPDAKRIIEDALAVDGATSASDFQTRAATRKDYASGIASRVTKSINTTIGHFATLDNAVDKLGNYSLFPKISNAVHDLYGSNMDPNYQKAKATFETNKEAAVKELDFALSGGHSSVSGSAEIRDKFNRADSPEALHAAITEAMSLLQKRLDSHTKAFTEGTKSQRDPQDFIYPENRAVFNKLLGQPGEPAGAQPAGLQPGQTTTIGGVSIKRVN